MQHILHGFLSEVPFLQERTEVIIPIRIAHILHLGWPKHMPDEYSGHNLLFKAVLQGTLFSSNSLENQLVDESTFIPITRIPQMYNNDR